MAGKLVIPSAYEHVQASAATTWTVQHNLGGNGTEGQPTRAGVLTNPGTPLIDVVIDVAGDKVRVNPQEVNVLDKNTLEIVFTTAQSGWATVIV